LNENLLPGPKLQPDIGQVLLRFRTNRVAIVGDLQKMFCQTALDESHWKFQLYLWRGENPKIEPKVFAMTRIMFGVTSSPFLAGNTVLKHANRKDMMRKYPTAAKKVKRDLYVDDFAGGGDNDSEVIQLGRELRGFFREGGWRIMKIASNSETVMNSIHPDDRLPGVVVDFDVDENDYKLASTLGLQWDTKDDVFMCKVSEKLTRDYDIVTKQRILSKAHSIYDVFGFFAPFTIRAKVLVQELWKLKVGWTDPLQGPIVDAFRRWESEIPLLEEIRIPRWIRTSRMSQVQIQGFCDASERTYGAIIYLATTDENGVVEVSFLLAKTRVAPLKVLSLARLELLAIHLLAKLYDYVIKAIPDLNISATHLWSDSTIALAWVSKPSSSWKTFVWNRVQEIHDLVSPSYFRHCPTQGY